MKRRGTKKGGKENNCVRKKNSMLNKRNQKERALEEITEINQMLLRRRE